MKIPSDRAWQRIGKSVAYTERQAQQGQRLEPPREVIFPGQLFYNDSGEEIPAYSIVKVKSTTPKVVGNEKALYVGKTDTTFCRHYLLSAEQAIPIGKYGRAQVGPVFRAAWDSSTAAVDEGWGPKPGQFTLSKGFPGISARGIHDSSGRIMLASLQLPLVTLLGKTTGAITGGSASTSYRFYAGGTLGSESDAGWTSVPSALSLTDIDSGLWIKLTFLANGWRMEPLECNA